MWTCRGVCHVGTDPRLSLCGFPPLNSSEVEKWGPGAMFRFPPLPPISSEGGFLRICLGFRVEGLGVARDWAPHFFRRRLPTDMFRISG